MPKVDFRIDLSDGIWYDATPDYHGVKPEGIRKVEELRSCSYVCEWNVLDANGDPHDQPMMIFWNDVPHPQGSNWMALYSSGGNYYVRDGITASRLPIQAYVSDSGQAVFSKHRHDFRSSQDGTITVDGGREYTRLMGNFKTCRRVWLLPQAGQLTIIDDSAARLLLSHHKAVA
jgi:hypothetical protein